MPAKKTTTKTAWCNFWGNFRFHLRPASCATSGQFFQSVLLYSHVPLVHGVFKTIPDIDPASWGEALLCFYPAITGHLPGWEIPTWLKGLGILIPSSKSQSSFQSSLTQPHHLSWVCLLWRCHYCHWGKEVTNRLCEAWSVDEWLSAIHRRRQFSCRRRKVFLQSLMLLQLKSMVSYKMMPCISQINGWDIKMFPVLVCVVQPSQLITQSMICKRGGFTTSRHNEIRGFDSQASIRDL